MHSSAILLLSRLSGGVGDDNHQTSKKYPENVFLFLLGGELSVTSRTSLLYISETSTCRLGRYFSTDVKGRRLGKKRKKNQKVKPGTLSVVAPSAAGFRQVFNTLSHTSSAT